MPVGFDVMSVITAELSAKVSWGQATPSAWHSASSSRKMYLGGTQVDYQNAIGMQSECNQQEKPRRGKDVLVKVCLKSFIGKVDEQLFERVGLKGLEPKDVEHAD